MQARRRMHDAVTNLMSWTATRPFILLFLQACSGKFHTEKSCLEDTQGDSGAHRPYEPGSRVRYVEPVSTGYEHRHRPMLL